MKKNEVCKEISRIFKRERERDSKTYGATERDQERKSGRKKERMKK